jgi:hypothetical protein
MQAISDSINIAGSKAYLRFYKRNDELVNTSNVSRPCNYLITGNFKHE